MSNQRKFCEIMNRPLMMSGSSAHEYVLKEYTTRVIRPRAQDIFSLIKRVAREEILPKFRNLDASEVAMKRSETDW